jgi:hypothetical protein
MVIYTCLYVQISYPMNGSLSRIILKPSLFMDASQIWRIGYNPIGQQMIYKHLL